MIGQELVLSKSSIDQALSCMYRYYLAYVLRLPSAPTLSMSTGTGTHSAVEAYWKGDDPEEALAVAMSRELALIPALVPIEAAAAVSGALAMWGTYLAHIVPTFPVAPSLIEADFLIRVDGTLVSGRIDVADGDVHDTKTTSTPSKVDPESHRLGMSLYRWGFRALTGAFPGRLVLDVVAKNGRWAVKPVEPDDQGMADAVGLVSSQINAGRFEPTGTLNGACHRCPYASGLCRYAKLD